LSYLPPRERIEIGEAASREASFTDHPALSFKGFYRPELPLPHDDSCVIDRARLVAPMLIGSSGLKSPSSPKVGLQECVLWPVESSVLLGHRTSKPTLLRMSLFPRSLYTLAPAAHVFSNFSRVLTIFPLFRPQCHVRCGVFVIPLDSQPLLSVKPSMPVSSVTLPVM